MPAKKKPTKTPSKPTGKAKNTPVIAQTLKSASAIFGIPIKTIKAAKDAGCDAFIGSRVHRDKLLAWLKKNPKAGVTKGNSGPESDMKERKLAAQVALLEIKVSKDNGSLVGRDMVKTHYSRVAAIFCEEAKNLMEADHYRVFCERTKSRVGSILPE